MADVEGKFFSAKKVRTGVAPSSPGIIVGDTQTPVNPPGSGGAADFVPLARVITINGNAQDLSADRTYNVGTVTSVGLTMPTAFTVANSPVTGAGTIGVTGAGTTAQYIRGDGSLATFPGLTGFVPYTGANQTVNLNTQQLQAGHTTLTTNGSTETLTIAHTSGSGVGVNITKAGNNEGLRVNKTSGSGNAATIIGTLEATTLVKTGGTAAQFLKADGTVDSNVYALNSALASYQLLSAKGQPNGYAGLDSNGKVPLAQINDALIGNVNFQGLWNAATNTPTLANPPAAGTKGYYYIVSTAGTFAGISFAVGDWIISNGITWDKVDNTDAVSSVFGRTGNVAATSGDYNTSQVTEVTNLYYTEARVNANTNVAANTAARHNAVTLGTANGLGLTGQQLSLGLASAGVTGALSGTDWSTFNNKQVQLNGTGFVKIVGTTISYDNSTYYLASNPSAFIALTALSAGAGISYNSTTGVITSTITQYTDALARAALSFVAGSGAYNSSTGVITIPTNNNQITNGANYITAAALGAYLPLAGGTMTGVITTPNGTFGIIIGDDSRLADRNVANTLFLEGNQNTDRGFINFSQTTGNSLGAVNGGNLTWRGDVIWHAGNITPVPTSRTITINGTSQDLSANRTFSVGTVTSVAALTLGTSGTDLSSTVANGTTTPVITLNVPTASAANRGALSAADWTTFNSKQNALTNPVTGTGSAGQVAYWSSGSAITGESNLFWDSTNDYLGIGTNGPAAGLEIVTDSGTANALRVVSNRAFNLNTDVAINFRYKYDSTNFTSGGLIVSAKDNNTSGNQSGNMQFYTNNGGTLSEKTRIFSDGNVLIQSGGTFTNNGARLQVSGAATFSSSVTAGGTFISSMGNNALIFNSSSATTGFQYATLINSGASMTLGIERSTGGALSNGSTAYASLLQTSNSTNLQFGTANTVRMTIDPNGNVGIGTVSPAVKFEVAGSGSIGYFRNPSATAATTFITVINANNTSNGLVMAHISDGTGYFGTQNSAALRLVTGDVERMRIFSDGNVHIGPTPGSDNGARLQVSGTATFSSSVTAGGAKSQFVASGGASAGASISLNTGLSGTSRRNWFIGTEENIEGDFTIKCSTAAGGVGGSGDTRLSILNNGNVGINTTNPSYQLTLNKASNPQIAFTTGDVLKAAITHITSDNSLRVFNNDGDKIVITSGGNVLIGTTTDSAGRLRVKASGNDTYAIAFERSNATTTIGGFYQNSGSSGELFLRASNGSDNVKISSTQFSYWAAPGVNFAIGIATDSNDKLRVNGTTFTNQIMTFNPENDNRSGINWRLGAASIASITPNRRLRVSVGGIEYYIGAVEV